MEHIKEYNKFDLDDFDIEEEDPTESQWYDYNTNLSDDIISKLKEGVMLNTIWKDTNGNLL